MKRCMNCGLECKNKFCSISCRNSIWNKILKPAKNYKKEKIDVNLVCKKCLKPFKVHITHTKIKSLDKSHVYCSRSCANSRTHTPEIKQKIRDTMNATLKLRNRTKVVNKVVLIKKEIPVKREKHIKYCINCNGIIHARSSKFYCSRDCRTADIKRKRELQMLDGTYADPRALKSYLISQSGHKCCMCKRVSWMGKPIPLILDHINGRAHDNRLENLRLVCGCCDMMLPTYKSKNKNSDRNKKRKENI